MSIAEAGVYWIGACTDPLSGETATNDNCSPGRQIVVGLPDLDARATGLGRSRTLKTGESNFPLSQVNNIGTAPSVPSTLRIYLLTYNTPISADTEIATFQVGAIPAGGRTSWYRTEVWFPEPGAFWYGYCVDVLEGDPVVHRNEFRTDNNCSTGVAVSITAAPVTAPDLTVDGIRVSQSSVEAGTSFTINATARNSGKGAANGTTLRYYRSTDDTITTDDSELATEPISALAASGFSSENASASIAYAGEYWVGACVGTVDDETETGNNCSSGVQTPSPLPLCRT